MNLDEYSIQVEPTTGDYPSFNDKGELVPYYKDYSLTETEELCFNCHLDDCKENSTKCLIYIANKKH